MNQSISKSAVVNKSSDSTKQTRITKQQLGILVLIYKFRFVSTKQVQHLLVKPQLQQAQQRLNTLLKKEYIGKNFSNLDRLTGQYASYYLLPKGLKALKQYEDTEHGTKVRTKTLHNIYKDKTASQRFITHQLALGDVCINLERIYSLSMHIFTKSNLVAYNYLINPLPDAFVCLKDDSKPKSKRTDYFLEYFEDNIPFWVCRNRIMQYVEYAEDETWEETTNTTMPIILLVCQSPILQRRTVRFLKRYLEETYEDISFYITDAITLRDSLSDKDDVWRVMDAGSLEEIVFRSIRY